MHLHSVSKEKPGLLERPGFFGEIPNPPLQNIQSPVDNKQTGIDQQLSHRRRLHQPGDKLSMNVRQSITPSLELIGQPLVIDPHQM